MRNIENYYNWYFKRNNITIPQPIDDLQNEEWRDIDGYEGMYMISNMGRIKSLARKGVLFDRIIKSKPTRTGYHIIGLRKGESRTFYLVHRLVAQAFLPNPNNLPEVNHKDEDLNNNTLDNLEWVTPKQNCNYGTRNQRISEKNKR